jgi:hypothetical protein
MAPTPATGNSAKPTPASTPSANYGGLPPAPVGKVLQPQPRSAEIAPVITRKDSSGKPAWRNPAATVSTVGKPDNVQNEFPTAAEVARGEPRT